jgi:hypothetical protein
MKVISSSDTLATIPTVMARAIRAIAEQEGTSAAAAIKRMLQNALAAEGEIELTPRPIGNNPVRVFQRIDTGHIDDVT